ncbi:MAG: DNA repair protein RecO [Bacteroidota bacterium]|nr:DNA repair protein RecO [Bacteroidota bacterium]
MFNQSKAIVLHSIKYGETSLIVNCFLYDLGLKSFIIKGVLNSKNKKFSKSYFLPLSILCITYSIKTNKDLGYITEAKPAQIYTSLHIDLFKSSVVVFIGELLNSVLKESPGSNQKLFQYLEYSLTWFDRSNKVSNFHLKVLIDLTKFIGFYPNIKEESHAFFDLNSGTSLEVKPSKYYIQNLELKKFKELLGMTFEDLNTMKLNNVLKAKMLSIMIDYYSLHLQMFKSPKSIHVFNEVFK